MFFTHTIWSFAGFIPEAHESARMIDPGMKAPDFSLPGIVDGQPDYYDLHRFVGHGHAAVLYFYPTDFVPTITPDLQALSDAGWHDRSDLVVWAISSDSLFAHEEYAKTRDIGFPLLSDLHVGIADGYDAVLEDWRGHNGVPDRGIVVVDDDWTVQLATSTDPLAEPDGSALNTARNAVRNCRGGDLADPTEHI